MYHVSAQGVDNVHNNFLLFKKEGLTPEIHTLFLSLNKRSF